MRVEFNANDSFPQQNDHIGTATHTSKKINKAHTQNLNHFDFFFFEKSI